jgi:predicted aldo/keto reductase-like oxidoreductase
MQRRERGKSDLKVSAVGLGCMGMTGNYGPAAGKQEIINRLHTAFDKGVTAPLAHKGQLFSAGPSSGLNRALP